MKGGKQQQRFVRTKDQTAPATKKRMTIAATPGWLTGLQRSNCFQLEARQNTVLSPAPPQRSLDNAAGCGAVQGAQASMQHLVFGGGEFPNEFLIQ